MTNFNPQDHMIKMGRNEYLEVKWRLVWFRHEHPSGSISTDYLPFGDVMVVKASVHNSDGHLLADGSATVRMATGHETKSWGGREIEKAETAAIGRALAHAGYGTQFTGEDEGDYLADSPVANKNPAKKSQNTKKTDSNPFKEANNRRKKVLEGTSFKDMNDLMPWANTNGVNWANSSADIIVYIKSKMKEGA